MGAACEARPSDAAVDAAVRDLAREVAIDVEDVAREVAGRVIAAMPELGAEADGHVADETLDSGRANVGAIASMLAFGVPVGGLAPPHGAVEFARAMIRRGVELPVILRAYRVGHAALSDIWLRRAVAALQADGPLLGAVLARTSASMFAYIDTICEQLVEECGHERRRWAQTAAAARARTARMLLDGEPADVEVAGRALGYELDRHHVALILWHALTDDEPEGGPALQRAAAVLAARAGCADPLLVPAGRGLLWAWLGSRDPFDADRLRTRLGEPLEDPVHVAAGSCAHGLAGFRASHAEAERVLRVHASTGAEPGAVTTYESVALLCALCADPAQAQAFAALELGPLLADDEGAAQLRETLAVYLRTGASHVRAARELGVHEKTVTYRVRRAEALLGRRVADRRVELAAALLVARSVALSARAN